MKRRRLSEARAAGEVMMKSFGMGRLSESALGVCE